MRVFQPIIVSFAVSACLAVLTGCCPGRAAAPLAESADAQLSHDPTTFWEDIETLIAAERYWRAARLLHRADPKEQALVDLEQQVDLPLGVMGFGLSFPGMKSEVFRDAPHRIMPGTSDFSQAPGEMAWNAEARSWAERYNKTLTELGMLYQLLDDGTMTVEEFLAEVERRRATTAPGKDSRN